MKRFLSVILLLSLLASAAAFVGCQNQGEGQDTESESASASDSGNTESRETLDKDEYLPLTEGGEPLYVIAYQSMNIPQGIEGISEAGDLAKAGNILASELENKLEGLDFKVVSDRKLSEHNKKAIAIGNISEISDLCYEGLRYFDYSIKENNGNIAVAAYTDGTFRTAISEIAANTAVIDGELYVKRSAVDKSYVYRYQVKELTVNAHSITDYVISCDASTSAAATLLRDKLLSMSGHIIPVETNSSAEYAIVITKDENITGYSIAMDGKKLSVTYSSDMDWSLLWQSVCKKLNAVSMDSPFDLASLSEERSGSDGHMIMSFNVLNVWNKNGTVGDRDDITASLVLGYMPDFIGLQEFDIGYRNAENGFISQISEKYAEVEIEGVEKNYVWNPIFYLKDKYTVVESGFVYFPDETTSHESSNYFGGTPDDKARFRSVVWAVLRDAEGAEFLIANLHFSPVDISVNHPGESSVAIRVIKEVAARYEGCITLVTGDYNSNRNTNNGGVATMVASGFTDTYDLAATRNDLRSNHEIGSAPASGYMAGAIDHILTLNELQVSAYLILTDTELLSISDHCPTIVQFTVPEQ